MSSGFRKCGIYPLDKEIIPKEAFAPSLPFDHAIFAKPSDSSSSCSNAFTAVSSTLSLNLANDSDWNNNEDISGYYDDASTFRSQSFEQVKPDRSVRRICS